MRFSSFVKRSCIPAFAALLLLDGAFLIAPSFAQSYGDVTVRKNPDGSIETFDTSSSSAPAPRRGSSSGHRRGTQKYSDGVVVRKNADGSIETFDSGSVGAPPHSTGRSSSSRAASKYGEGATVRKKSGSSTPTPPKSKVSSTSVHKFVHKYSKDVTVKKNPDGTIEVIGFEGAPAPRGKSQSSAKATSSANSSSTAKSSSTSKSGSTSKSSTSTKAGSAARTKHHSARRPRGHGNFGDVRVIRNPDGSIETYDSN